METRTFDPQAAWERLLENPEFTTQAPEGPARELFREFVTTKLAEVAGDQLSLPVSVGSLMETQRRIAHHYVDTDFLGRLIDAMPEEMLGFLGKDAARGMMTAMFAGLVEMLDQIIPNVPAFLQSQGVTEEQMLQHPKGGGLSPISMAAWRAETLTVGGLLNTEPWAVLNMNKK